MIQKRKLSEKILNEIKTNNDFLIEISSFFNIQLHTVVMLANRKSAKLQRYEIVEFYKKQGFSENEIFD